MIISVGGENRSKGCYGGEEKSNCVCVGERKLGTRRGRIAQSVERSANNAVVLGSSPSMTNFVKLTCCFRSLFLRRFDAE